MGHAASAPSAGNLDAEDLRQLIGAAKDVDTLRRLQVLYGRAMGYSGRQIAEWVGISQRHAIRWHNKYKSGGLAALMTPQGSKRAGRQQRLQPTHLESVRQAIKDGEILHYKQAVAFLEDLGYQYSVSGVHKLLNRHKSLIKDLRP